MWVGGGVGGWLRSSEEVSAIEIITVSWRCCEYIVQRIVEGGRG